MEKRPKSIQPVKEPRRFCGVRTAVWYGIAKWFSIGGVGLAAVLTAAATAYHAIWGK